MESVFRVLLLGAIRDFKGETRTTMITVLLVCAVAYFFLKLFVQFFQQARQDPRIRAQVRAQVKNLPSKTLDVGIGGYVALRRAGRYLKKRADELERKR